MENSKLFGIKWLIEKQLSVPPTLFIESKPLQLSLLEKFVRDQENISGWVIRSVVDGFLRYELGNKTVSSSQLLINSKWINSTTLPIAIQPIIAAKLSGIAFISADFALCEFSNGSSGKFLRGLEEPNRALFSINGDHFVFVESNPKIDNSHKDVLSTLSKVLNMLIGKSVRFSVEWIVDQENVIWFVDCRWSSKNFLAQSFSLSHSPTIFVSGDIPKEVRNRHYGLHNKILRSQWPGIDLVKTIESAQVEVLIIDKGSWLSHLALRADDLNIRYISLS